MFTWQLWIPRVKSQMICTDLFCSQAGAPRGALSQSILCLFILLTLLLLLLLLRF